MVIFQWAKTVPKKQKQHQQGLLTNSIKICLRKNGNLQTSLK